MIRVHLPEHLRRLAGVEGDVLLDPALPVSVATVLDALETAYPMLRGTTRDHLTRKRRPFVRFFALGEDLSHQPAETPLPAPVTAGDEPLLIIGAMAGG